MSSICVGIFLKCLYHYFLLKWNVGGHQMGSVKSIVGNKPYPRQSFYITKYQHTLLVSVLFSVDDQTPIWPYETRMAPCKKCIICCVCKVGGGENSYKERLPHIGLTGLGIWCFTRLKVPWCSKDLFQLLEHDSIQIHYSQVEESCNVCKTMAIQNCRLCHFDLMKNIL